MILYDLLMISLGLLSIISPPIIYWDATRNKIGKIKEIKSFWNIPAEGWGFCALFLGWVTLIGYLVQRKKLIERAKIYPRESKNILLKLILIIVISVAFNVGAALRHEPNSHDLEKTKTAEQ